MRQFEIALLVWIVVSYSAIIVFLAWNARCQRYLTTVKDVVNRSGDDGDPRKAASALWTSVKIVVFAVALIAFCIINWRGDSSITEIVLVTLAAPSIVVGIIALFVWGQFVASPDRRDVNEAFAIYEQQGLHAVIEHLEETVARGDASAEQHNALGVFYCEASKWDEALKAFERAIDRDQNHVFAKLNRGIPLWKLGRIEESLPLLKQQRDTIPLNVTWVVDYAMALAESGRTEEARRELGVAEKVFSSWTPPTSAAGHALSERIDRLRELCDAQKG